MKYFTNPDLVSNGFSSPFEKRRKNWYLPSTLASWTLVGIQPTEMKVAVKAPSEWFIKGVAKVKFNPKMPSLLVEILFRGHVRISAVSNKAKMNTVVYLILLNQRYMIHIYIFPKEETYDPDK